MPARDYVVRQQAHGTAQQRFGDIQQKGATGKAKLARARLCSTGKV